MKLQGRVLCFARFSKSLVKCLLCEAFRFPSRKNENSGSILHIKIVHSNGKNTLSLTNELFIKVSALRRSRLEIFPPGKVLCICTRRQVACEMFIVCCSPIRSLVAKNYGRDPFDQNFRKFRYKIKWNRTFLEIRFENCGQPPEVVLKFRKNGMHGKSRSI